MAVSYRNHGMTAIEIGVCLTVLVPKCGVESLDRLNVPQFIYFK
jgi:hypothetical protein